MAAGQRYGTECCVSLVIQQFGVLATCTGFWKAGPVRILNTFFQAKFTSARDELKHCSPFTRAGGRHSWQHSILPIDQRRFKAYNNNKRAHTRAWGHVSQMYKLAFNH